MKKRSTDAWEDGQFEAQTLRIRHATHGDLTYRISRPALYMIVQERGGARFAVEVETDDPPAGHPLDVLGPASIWLWGVKLPTADLDRLAGRVLPCNDWLERGGQVREYVVMNLHDSLETRDTAIRFVTPSRLQIATVAEDVDAYDERARPNAIYVDAALAAEPTRLVSRVADA